MRLYHQSHVCGMVSGSCVVNLETLVATFSNIVVFGLGPLVSITAPSHAPATYCYKSIRGWTLPLTYSCACLSHKVGVMFSLPPLSVSPPSTPKSQSKCPWQGNILFFHNLKKGEYRITPAHLAMYSQDCKVLKQELCFILAAPAPSVPLSGPGAE